jgi:hypothetical protein
MVRRHLIEQEKRKFQAYCRPLRGILGAAAIFSLASGCGDESSGAPVAKPEIGVNLNTIAFWDGSRPFDNLIYGSDWQMQGPRGGQEVPSNNLDAEGWVKALPAGYRVVRTLSVPSSTTQVTCRWQGNDHNSMEVRSDGVTSNAVRKAGANELKFDYRSSYPGAKAAFLTFTVDPSSYVRDLNCREASDHDGEGFDPVLVGALRGFGVVRFMKWQSAVEANRPVTWATRNKPGAGSYFMNDGVPVETMVALANEVGAAPWFTMPWNADDDYIAKFATYVRDNIPTNRQVYVETSNEVWNGGYPVMHQAQAEGVAEGLDANNGAYGQAMYRYAEKTQHVMRIWGKVFAGQDNRLVRVISAQNVSPFWSDKILGYGDTADYVDALATAPYWAFMDADYSGQSLDRIMDRVLPAQIVETLNRAAQQKAIARKHHKRFIAYEGGQHVWLTKNPPLVARIERDPRMAGLYKSYIDGWNGKIGDTLTLFALTGAPGNAGFGLVEYAGQPIGDAPKMRAVRSFLRQPGSAVGGALKGRDNGLRDPH